MTIDSAGGRPAGALRLAVQKDGRLTDDTLALLAACGLDFDRYRSRLFAPCRNFPLSILYGRDDDIPGYVASGVVDIGIVGANMLLAHADGRHGRKALQALDFYAHLDLFMNPTAELADVVLPVA